ncbi:rhodanese-like domain-containing protein [Ferruginibacter yonginensis]|uniref:Rhodanese-like domain-containing protein n=1 Tax=Ferruginibacter yonginensis TaxID=1310416 RepID=A0ABV8QQD1_9BACT
MNNISVKTLKERLANNEALHLLDVREPDERNEFNIGGHFIPLGQVMSFQVDDIEHLKNEEVICYCRSGKRSMQAAMMLETMGFTNVVNVEGGMLAWQSEA